MTRNYWEHIDGREANYCETCGEPYWACPEHHADEEGE